MSCACATRRKQGKPLTAPAQLHFLVASLKATKSWIFINIRHPNHGEKMWFSFSFHFISDKSFLAHVLYT